jgi:peptide/nickel transport system ATP-binding protein
VQKLSRETGTAVLWITHDLAVVAELADRVAVMYAGRIVETGPVDDVLDRPRHPYTLGLLNSSASHGRARRAAEADRRRRAAHRFPPERLPVPAALRARFAHLRRQDPAPQGDAERNFRCHNPVPLAVAA